MKINCFYPVFISYSIYFLHRSVAYLGAIEAHVYGAMLNSDFRFE